MKNLLIFLSILIIGCNSHCEIYTLYYHTPRGYREQIEFVKTGANMSYFQFKPGDSVLLFDKEVIVDSLILTKKSN